MVFHFESLNSENIANSLSELFSAFGISPQWTSDQGTHFKIEVIASLKETLRCSHHFTLPYCSWSNGTVDVACRELLCVLRVLILKLKFPFKLWPSMPILQSVLNNTSIKRLRDRASITAFTGLQASIPLLHIKPPRNSAYNILSISETRARQAIPTSKLATSMDEMHKNVTQKVKYERKRSVKQHNKRANAKKCNFDIGYFVLRTFYVNMRLRILL